MLLPANCPICIETFKEPVVTKCGHMFCKDCIDHCFADSFRIPCPYCRKTVRNTEIISFPHIYKEVQTTSGSSTPKHPYEPNGYGLWTELHEALKCGDLKKAKQLIKSGCDIRLYSDENTNGRCPIHVACSYGHLEIVELFVKQDSEIARARTLGQGLLPVHSAALFGHLPIVRYFIDELQIDVESQSTSMGRSILHCACESGNLETVIFLIRRGADVRARSNLEDGRNLPIHLAAYFGHLNVVKYIIENINMNMALARNENGAIPFHRACLYGRLNVVIYLVNIRMMDIDITTSKPERTGLHFASQSGNLDLVKFLIQQGADIRRPGDDGKTCFHFAAYCGYMEIVKHLLLLAPSLMNFKDQNGKTPLAWTRESTLPGAHEVAEYLK